MMNKLYTDKFDVIIDHSEYYDITLDDTNYIDLLLCTDNFDFTLSDDLINENDLIFMETICVGCNDAVRSLLSEYAFLLTNDGNYLEINNGGLLLFH